MTKRLTAEEVAERLEWWSQQFSGARSEAISDCAKMVRENLIESDDQRRERFERWCRGLQMSTHRRGDGLYLATLTGMAWDAWQAALTYRDSEES